MNLRQFRRRTLSQLAIFVIAFGALVSDWCLAASESGRPNRDERYRTWIDEMKTAERGPFSRIRWFCADGQILPPKPYACEEFGGGAQHGEWSAKTRELRDKGYEVATVYADLDIDGLLGDPEVERRLAKLLIEQYLLKVDDGWILRRARYYRGAFQEEGEQRGAIALLTRLAEERRWLTTHFAVFRTAVASLEHGRDAASAVTIRQESASLSDEFPQFKPLRNKIHGRLERTDASAVREFAASLKPAQRVPFEALARQIDELYAADIHDELNDLRNALKKYPEVRNEIAVEQAALSRYDDAFSRYVVTAKLLALLREAVVKVADPTLRIAIVDASLQVEAEHFKAGTGLDESFFASWRRVQLMMLRAGGEAAFGSGLISQRQRQELVRVISKVAVQEVTLAAYKETVDTFSLLPTWGQQRLQFHFLEAMNKMFEIEPKAHLFIQDRLRGSTLFFVAKVADRLRQDANRLAGVSVTVFEENVGAGIRPLNPGVARGPLRRFDPDRPDDREQEIDADSIYLLPETLAELPPVAGILTAGEGNPLSHVQLLARNLGIPNASVEGDLLTRLRGDEGSEILMAVSPQGSILIDRDDPKYDVYFKKAASEPEKLIQVNVEKLNLEYRDFATLSELRASDSGRIVGPKAAKLGELKTRFDSAVAEGLAIPFGIFRDLLAQPVEPDGPPMFEWMQTEYRRIEAMPERSLERAEATERLRETIYAWVLNVDPGDDFRQRLRSRLQEVFGADGSYGVFVRSDTNVEDLPGFTGAGLNLTVANVVGEDEIIRAISRVWASPFTKRAFAWRQSHMDKPEHVYPAVLLMLSVNADKSGVLVTEDLDTGDRSWLSVAVNEGVGGAVDGQSAESLRINMDSEEVRLLAAASAPLRRVVTTDGGVKKVPASGADYVLEKAEVKQLIEFAKSLPETFPPIVDQSGAPAAADVEFGFLDGELRLFQIRPFLDSGAALSSRLLRELDALSIDLATKRVNIDDPPQARE